MAVAPIFAARPDLVCDVGPLQAWFTEPAGAVVQLMDRAKLTVRMAEWVVGPGFGALCRRFEPAHGFVLVIDLHPMTEREPAVRALAIEAGREQLWRFRSAVMIAPQDTKPIYRVALQTAVALLSAFGPGLAVEDSAERAIARFELRPASP